MPITMRFRNYPLARLLFKRIWPVFAAGGTSDEYIVVWTKLSAHCWPPERDKQQLQELLIRAFESPKRKGRLDVLFVPILTGSRYAGMEVGLVWLPGATPHSR